MLVNALYKTWTHHRYDYMMIIVTKQDLREFKDE